VAPFAAAPVGGAPFSAAVVVEPSLKLLNFVWLVFSTSEVSRGWEM